MSEIVERRKEAIRKTLAHLEKRGDEPVTVTPDIVRYWCRVLNFAVFDGIMPLPHKIVCREFKNGFVGWCEGHNYSKDVDIGIKTSLPSRRLMISTIVHEMVHQWQWIHTRTITHGQSFLQWRHIVRRRLGLKLDKEADDL